MVSLHPRRHFVPRLIVGLRETSKTRFSITEQISHPALTISHVFSLRVALSRGFYPSSTSPPGLWSTVAPQSCLEINIFETPLGARRSPSKPISKSNRPPTSPQLPPPGFVLLVIIVDRGTLIEKFRPSSAGFPISFHREQES